MLSLREPELTAGLLQEKRIAQGLSLLLLQACLGAVPAQAQDRDHRFPTPFKLVIFQENRTPDNLFQGLCHPPFGHRHSCRTTPAEHQYTISTTGWLDKNSPAGLTDPEPVPLEIPAVGGPSWVASIVNAIGNDTTSEDGESYWSDTAIVITWDDWGGWYDNERPTILDGVQGDYQYGFRVPLIVVSAFTPRQYIDNEQHDFGSILRFIHGLFGLRKGSLGFADTHAT